MIFPAYGYADDEGSYAADNDICSEQAITEADPGQVSDINEVTSDPVDEEGAYQESSVQTNEITEADENETVREEDKSPVEDGINENANEDGGDVNAEATAESTETYDMTEEETDDAGNDITEPVSEKSVPGSEPEEAGSEESGPEPSLVRESDGKFYEDGTLLVNCWVDYEGKKYFVDQYGIAYHDRFISFGSTYYYMGSDGSVQIGMVTTPDRRLYFADENGLVKRTAGWVNYSDCRYFAREGGELYHDQFISFGSTRYYMGADGSVQTGILNTPNSKMYFADENGLVKHTAGWVNYSEHRYFAREGGELYRNQFISFGSTRYYMGSDASVQTGILNTLNSKMYFADDSGLVKYTAGWINYNDHKYFAKEGGELYRDQFISFGSTRYYMGSDASVQTGILVTPNNRLYFADENGLVKSTAGWINYNGIRYFAREGGELYRDQFISFGGTYYYMGSDGSIQTGIIITPNCKLYYADESGLVKRTAGWINYNDHKYFAKEGGELYHDQFIGFGGSTYYYMGSDGAAVTGEQTIAGRTYTFRDNCTLVGKPLPPLKGIDVSEFQGNINWGAVKKSGIDFAFIRAGGRGGTSGNIYWDEKFSENVAGAINNGIRTGVYFFTQAINTSEAIQEADLLCDKVAGLDLSLPVVVDTESLIIDGGPCRHNRISAAQRTEVIKAFCEQVIKRGMTPMIYGSTSWLEDELYMSELPYKVWVAQYYDHCEYEGDYIYWQYSETGRVNGIDGYVDMNYWVN